jgi:hypothetical protein
MHVYIRSGPRLHLATLFPTTSSSLFFVFLNDIDLVRRKKMTLTFCGSEARNQRRHTGMDSNPESSSAGSHSQRYPTFGQSSGFSFPFPAPIDTAIYIEHIAHNQLPLRCCCTALLLLLLPQRTRFPRHPREHGSPQARTPC